MMALTYWSLQQYDHVPDMAGMGTLNIQACLFQMWGYETPILARWGARATAAIWLDKITAGQAHELAEGYVPPHPNAPVHFL